MQIIWRILDWALVSSMSSSWGAKGYTLEVIAENKNSGMDENRFFNFM